MNDMAVIVPTRGRPDSVKRMMQAWVDTEAEALLVFGIDDDDEAMHDPQAAREIMEFADQMEAPVEVHSDPHVNMGTTLNTIVMRLISSYDHIGFAGDDHLFQTKHWDSRFIEDLGGRQRSGIAYGNDLFQGAKLPTAVFMTSDIPATTGYLYPPGLSHLYADDIWKAWGEGMGRLFYHPEIIIEHLHYQAEKSEFDEGYARVNGGGVWSHDGSVYEAYKASGTLEADIEKLKGLL